MAHANIRQVCSSVSVIVPCHNYGRFLRETIASLDVQTLKPYEVLLIDDGSDDETPQVIEEILVTHPSMRSISRRPAQGAVSTFNDGIKATSGDLIVILSADDRASPSYLADLAEKFEDPAVGFAYAEMRLFGARQGLRPARAFDPKSLARRNFVNGSAMFRRDVYEHVGGFDERFSLIGKEDWAFFLRATSLGYKGAPVTSCYLEYRQHDSPSRNSASLSTLLVTRWHLHQIAPRAVRAWDLVIGGAADVRAVVKRKLRAG